MRELEGVRIELAALHAKMPKGAHFKWASYGDVAEALDRPRGGKGIAQSCIRMLWQNCVTTMQFAEKNGTNTWAEFDVNQPNYEVVRYLHKSLAASWGIPAQPWSDKDKLSVEELRQLIAK